MGPPMKQVRKVRVEIAIEMDIAKTILHAGRISADLGFGVADQSRVATAASELARNILKYAGKGHVTITPMEYDGRAGIEIVAEDRGPGIEDVEQAMKDRYSSSGTLGLGLPGVRRLMDVFRIESAPGKGTRVMALKLR
jgi:serine/threonine-protein kinase RsbT